MIDIIPKFHGVLIIMSANLPGTKFRKNIALNCVPVNQFRQVCWPNDTAFTKRIYQ